MPFLSSTELLTEAGKRRWSSSILERLLHTEVARHGRRGDAEAHDSTIWELETPPLIRDSILGKQSVHSRLRWLLCGVAEAGSGKIRVTERGGGLVSADWQHPWLNYPLLRDPLIDLGRLPELGMHVILDAGQFDVFSRSRAEGQAVLYSMGNWIRHVQLGIPLSPLRTPWAQLLEPPAA